MQRNHCRFLPPRHPQLAQWSRERAIMASWLFSMRTDASFKPPPPFRLCICSSCHACDLHRSFCEEGAREPTERKRWSIQGRTPGGQGGRRRWGDRTTRTQGEQQRRKQLSSSGHLVREFRQKDLVRAFDLLLLPNLSAIKSQLSKSHFPLRATL